MSNNLDMAAVILEQDEGFEPEPYYCSENYPTIGHGFRISGTNRHDPLPKNMSMTHPESLAKLRAMLVTYDATLRSNKDTCRAYELASDTRKAVMLSMVHQLGMYGVLKFKKFIAAMASKDYEEAAKQCLDSIAAKQTPNRWKRNASMIESGNLHAYYA